MIKLKNRKKGFSLLEILISLSLFFLIFSAVISFLFSMNIFNLKIKTDSEVSEAAKSVLEKIIYEIRSAKSVYTPTTTSNQLSLETTRYLPEGESTTFVDFFRCGEQLEAICFKRESEEPIIITPSSIKITEISFIQISETKSPSIQIVLAAAFVNREGASIRLTSTVSLRH